MKKNKVLILSKHHAILKEILTQKGYECIEYIQKPLLNLDVDFKNQIIGIVTSNSCFMPASNIDLFPNLKFIGRLGSGMEIIDVEYAISKKIDCFGSPEGNANAVAEHALGLLINLLNNIPKSFEELKKGRFDRLGNMGTEISNLKIGIVGYGTNGRQFAHYLALFGPQIYLFDKDPKEYPKGPNIHFSTHYSDIINECNCLSFHLPIDQHAVKTAKEIIVRMKNPFYFLNIARGGLVDLNILYEYMIEGKIIGAAIDVWPEEPLDSMNKDEREIAYKLLQLPNFIGTPHIAGYTHQAFFKMSQIIAEKIPYLNNYLAI